MSAIIYAANFAIFVINHDVRTDTMLTGFVIFTIWQLYEYLQTKKKLNFIFGFVGIGLAMSTKGPLGLLIPALALGPYLLYQRRWKDIFRPEWLIGLVIIFIVLLPMIITVYNQHGMHGIKFHFWYQSFGRITGDTKWEDTTGPLFFVHSFLWSFIPWTILALIAYVRKWIDSFKAFGKDENFEIITLSGITLVFIAMSMAQYKLPHYTYVVFPLVAIITADYIDKSFKPVKWEGFGAALTFGQITLNTILWIAVVLTFFLFSGAPVILFIIEVMLFAGYLYLFVNKKLKVPKIFSTTLITILAVAFVLNLHFYPSLSPFQAGGVVGRDIREMKLETEQVLIYQAHKPSTDVYAHQTIPRSFWLYQVDSVFQDKNELYIITGKNGLDSLLMQDYSIEQIESYKDYQISLLSLPFLNPETRERVLSDLYLLSVRKN
jgi:4-amino-4-deoxy-L-arabinose transferase-like glycosyltransferase